MEGIIDHDTTGDKILGTYLHRDLLMTPYFSMPREFASNVQAGYDPQKRVLSLSFQPAEDPRFPPSGEVVRGGLKGLVHLTPMTFPDQTFLRAEYHCELNGKMPAWVVNLIEQAWPQKAFRALRTRVGQGDLEVLPEVRMLLTANPPPGPTARRRRGRSGR
jgi:hypothetical protein